MSEKVRSLNLSTAGGGGGGAGVSSAGVSSTLIGNPTLISSTLGTNHNLTPTIDLLTSPSQHHHHQQQQHHHQHHHQQGSDIESLSDYAPGTITAQLNFQILPANTTATDTTNQILTGQHHHGNGINFDYNSIMNTSQMSAISQDSLQQPQQQQQNSLNAAINNATTAAATATSQNCMALVKAGAGKPVVAQSVAGKTCRFPKLEECAHFHYERVQLGPLSVRLVDDKSELLNSSIASQSIGGDIAGAISSSQGPPSYRSFSPSSCWFIIKVFPHRSDAFLVKRSFDNMQMFDEMLHRCVYDRKISGLKDLNEQDFKSEEDVEYAVAKYLERFSKIASDSLTCGTILTWLQLDNKGRRLPLADDDTMRCINTPAVGAAYGVRRYQAQASDEISIEVGDMISVIDMPSPAESVWWRGKKSHLQKSHYEVGFFPQSCVATIGDKVPRNFPMPAPLVGQLDVSPTKPVLRKHGKLIAFFRSFILSRPSRRRLKQSGIYRERVFSCDLSEHLLNSGQEIPMVLKCCAEFIEEYGIVDGIYRLSGITSNIQKLRRAFDEERVPDLGNPEMKQDIHAVSSLLKMYFRELPNPLCTYQLYDNFVEAIQTKGESTERLRLMKETVLKLPPPHYRTLKYLSEHLNKISQFSDRTGMTDKNLAIVWAPNLLRSPALESGGVAALRGVGVQAVVTEYLIRNCHHIFDVLEEAAARLSYIATQAANAAATHTPSSVTSENRMDSLTDCESLLVEQREHDQSMTACVVERPKSLSAGGPKLISLEEAQERHLKYDGFDMKHSMPINMISSVNSGQNIGSYIEVGGGPSSLPDKYHTVLSAPRSWQKRKTHSWKSLFSRNQRPVSNGAAHDLKSSIVISSTHRHNEDDDESSSPPPSHRRHHSKEVNQVTFADVDSIIGENGKSLKAVGGSGLLKRDDKHKSIELFETSRSYCGEASKPIEICVRSNSIDSLRTAGHSRSVSHDSYFDLLQSPLKGQLTTCPSRELSELGLNFDREEPEMRIFSESESLVSSPRVGKENIPPSSGSTSRRIMRARPEEFSSQTNSVNPSPKKQPRLNLLLSPSAAAANSAAAGNWSERGIGITAASSGGNAAAGQHNVPSIAPNGIECSADNCKEQHNGDESCCKRYKLEDQLSDIQYIDCGTPEHAVNNPQTMFTNVQVHAPPKPSLSKSSLYGSSEIPTIQRQDSSKTSSNATSSPSYSSSLNTRYSYPSVQLGAKRKDQEANAQAGANSAGNAKERFSYPGTTKAQQQHQHEKRYGSKEITPKMLVEEMEAAAVRKKEGEPHLTKARTVSFSNTPSSNNSSNSSPKTTNNKQHLTPKPTAYDLHKIRNRNSYCAASNDHQLQQSLQQQLLLRSYSGDITKENKTAHNNKSPSHRHLQHSHHLNNEMEQSKLSVTPSSPMQSPRYSLLMGGDTSSENSSAVNTPQHDLEPLMMASIMSGISGISAASSQQMQQLLLGDTASSYMGTSRESLQSNVPEKRDMQALKRELSLDLNTVGGNGGPAGNSTAHQGNTNHSKLAAADLTASVRNQNMISPNSNFTDNTSQSVTPSEFGYQHLQRQLSMHSLIETEENSPAYDDEYENTPSNLNSPLLTTNSGHSGHTGGSATVTASSGNNKTLASPIKSTISITYNLKSPTKDSSAKDKDNKTLGLMEEAEQERSISESITLPLETSFDENVVYEQVKMFRNSVIEVNQLLNNEERKFPALEKNLQEIEELSEESKDSSDKQTPNENLEDIQMCEDEKLLYQNVELRKPKSVYQNILGEEMKSLLHEQEQEHESSDEPDDAEVELDSLDSIPDDHVQLDIGASARKSPSNFSVKELATKFEISPVEQMPAFDFSASAHRSSLRTTRPPTINNHTHPERNAKENKPAKQRQQVPPKPPRLKQQQQEEPPQFRSHQEQQRHSLATHHQSAQKLNKNQAFTRSLDENAFIREFGTRNLQELTIKSSQQIPDVSSADFSSRRKSFDFTRPKTLNPPKRLPGMPIAEEQHYSTPIYSSAYSTTYSSISPSSQKTNAKEKNYNNLDTVSDYSSLEHEYETLELKITPTTENRISLIQNNVQQQQLQQQDNNLDLNNSNNANANPQMKVLSGVKLDRDRINRIKEERRQQLTQKYHTDSLKSKSKTDLNSLKNDDEKFSTDHQNPSLRVKSKSRADMRTLQKDMDNLKEFGGRNPPASAVSETTLNSSSQQQHRVRSISDEKNQNSYQQQEQQQQQQQQQTNVNNLNSANNELSAKRSSHSSVQRIKNVGSITANDEEFSARATVHKFERKSMDLINGGLGAGTATGVTSTNSSRERSRHGGGEGHIGASMGTAASRNSISSNREKISPQFSIRDVTAMFESRSQNQQ